MYNPSTHRTRGDGGPNSSTTAGGGALLPRGQVGGLLQGLSFPHRSAHSRRNLPATRPSDPPAWTSPATHNATVSISSASTISTTADPMSSSCTEPCDVHVSASLRSPQCPSSRPALVPQPLWSTASLLKASTNAMKLLFLRCLIASVLRHSSAAGVAAAKRRWPTPFVVSTEPHDGRHDGRRATALRPRLFVGGLPDARRDLGLVAANCVVQRGLAVAVFERGVRPGLQQRLRRGSSISGFT